MSNPNDNDKPMTNPDKREWVEWRFDTGDELHNYAFKTEEAAIAYKKRTMGIEGWPIIRTRVTLDEEQA